MNKKEAHDIIEKTFEYAYSEKAFRNFINQIFDVRNDTYQELTENAASGQIIKESFRDHIASSKRLAKLTDKTGKKIDIIAVKVKNSKKLDYARTMQRNFIAHHLDTRSKDAALVAFYADDSSDWRFSLVTLDYVYDAEKNKIKEQLPPAKRYSFLVGESEKTHTAQMQFVSVLTQSYPVTLDDFKKAFDIEKVTDEFFAEYKKLYLSLRDALNNHLTTDIKTKAEFDNKNIKTDDFAKRLLGQIVFLYFLQKKGWLGVAKNAQWGTGSKTFLQDLLKEHTNKNYFNDILEPLFYEALASERENHFYTSLNCKIPFLNGGLFEPIREYDWQNTDILLDNVLFADIFKTFDLYNFTVREDEPLDKEVAVDPEMLGKVFENLIPENERKGSGTFYTPREIVHYMCTESLINYLDTALNIQKRPIENTAQQTLIPDLVKRDLLTQDTDVYMPIIPREVLEAFTHTAGSSNENDETALRKMGGVTLNSPPSEGCPVRDGVVISPTAETTPSGFACHPSAGGELIAPPKSTTYSPKLDPLIITHAQAIDDALSTIKICDPAIGSGAFPVGILSEIVRVRYALNPFLPNKDRTLYDLKRHTIQESIYGVDIESSAVDIARLRLWLSLVVDEDNFEKIEPLPNLDYKIVVGNSLLGFPYDTQKRHDELRKLKPLKADYINAHSPSLKKKLRSQINTVIQSEYDKSCEKSLGYKVDFDFNWSFFEVFDTKGGFDIVIGNPPYVQMQKEQGKLADLYKDKKFKTFTRTGDIYMLFYEKGIDVLNKTGVSCLITSNKWLRAGYGEILRQFFVTKAKPILLVDLGANIFDTATVDTNILFIGKSDELLENGRFDKLSDRSLSLSKGTLNTTIDAVSLHSQKIHSAYGLYDLVSKNICNIPIDANQWIILDKAALSIKQKLQIIGKPLKDWNIEINYGIKTGYNEAFIIDNATKEKLCQADKKSIQILKPILRGRDIKKWKADYQGLWIITTFPALKINIDDYPAVKKYLEGFGEKLHQIGTEFINISGEKEKTRKKSGNKWFETQDNIAYHANFDKEKIIYPNMSKFLPFVYDETQILTNQKCFIMTGDNLKYLVAILNSTVSSHWIQNNCPELQGGTRELSYIFMQHLPIPNIPELDQAPFVDLTNRILELTGSDDYGVNADKQAQVASLQAQIDTLMYRLYGLTADEVKVIEGGEIEKWIHY